MSDKDLYPGDRRAQHHADGRKAEVDRLEYHGIAPAHLYAGDLRRGAVGLDPVEGAQFVAGGDGQPGFREVDLGWAASVTPAKDESSAL